MKGKLSVDIKYLILSLLLFAGFSLPSFSQKNISGKINKYGRVVTLGVDNVIVDAASYANFNVGDTVLLIQMKGVAMIGLEGASFGSAIKFVGDPGRAEFLTIESKPGGNQITFRNDIANTLFNTQGYIQLVRVPSYNFAVVNSKLECEPWDSTTKTGGVLTAIIGRTLSLQADIDVSGQGFKGGDTTKSLGNCMESDLIWNKYAYSLHSFLDSAGIKGEGLANFVDTSGIGTPPYLPLLPKFSNGKGPSFTGGGGGDGRFSGGGGGANYGRGGRGGRQKTDMCSLGYGGEPSKEVPGASTLFKGLFLGGGGGGSTYNVGVATKGGNGGGIVILICDTLKGNGKNILARGASPAGNVTGNAGAGGGGAGGSIALYLQSYSLGSPTANITLSSNGGNGGSNTTQTFGEGGGGGGGIVTTNLVSVVPAGVTKTVTGGAVGSRTGTINLGQPGSDGVIRTDYAPILNGFLFNSIRSSVTGNQVDSICSNVTPKPITGTIPLGVGPFSYQWQKSYNLAGAESIIAGANSKDYTPAATEANTFWIRRIVTDNGATPTVITDTSKWVNIIVQPAITGNLVGKDTTICYNQNPTNLIPLNSGPLNGNGRYTYQWIQNNDNVWPASTNSPGSSANNSYDPPQLTLTTYYKRVVTSGRCVDNSSAVTITVLTSITGNITTKPDSVICEGSLFNTLGASSGSGATGSYVYQWQDSITTGLWQPAAGINTGGTHNPDTSQFAVTEQRYFRRVVFSGPDSVCHNNSRPILLTRYHKIKNNTIATDATICSGTVPAALTGSDPTQGNLAYTYEWQDSTYGQNWAAKSTSKTPYAPPALNDTTWFRRVVNSSKCTNASSIVVINVHKPILNNAASLISGTGPDTTICSGAIPNKIKGSVPTGGTDLPGDYAYEWYYSTNNIAYAPVATAGTLIDYQPGNLTVTTWFRRKAISGMCSSESNTIRVIVLPPITNNIISASQVVCYNTSPAIITGPALTGGAGGTPTWLWQQSTNSGSAWSTASGTSNGQNYTPPPLLAETWYRRIILSGLYNCCIDTSNVVTLGIKPLPTAAITTLNDTTICSGSSVELKIHLTGTPNWKVIYNETAGSSVQVTVNNISTADYTILRVPSPSSGSVTFNYSLFSVEDGNGCLATSKTGSRNALVYRVPVPNAGPDVDVCGFGYKLAAVPSDGSGLWTFPAEVLSATPTLSDTKVKIDSSFTDKSKTLKFYWEETNWTCIKKDSVLITFFNNIDTINAGRDTAIFSFDNIFKVDAYPLLSYENGKWTNVSGIGTGDFENDASSSTYIRNISPGLNKYLWTVTNENSSGVAVCSKEDEISIDVSSPVIPEGLSPNGDLINDSLSITGLDFVNQAIDMTILNGAGTIVFSTSNQSGGTWVSWDGKNKNGVDLPEGTYYYLLKVASLKTGKVSSKSGFIILKRN
jgi:gliding motility-associated-like protein